MSPWVEERALALAIHVIRGFSENTSTGCLGASKEFVDRRDTKCDGVRRRALLCRRSGVSVPGLATMMAPLPCKSCRRSCELRRRSVNGRAVVSQRDCFGHVGIVEHGYYGGVGAERFFFSIESEVITASLVV